MSHPPRSGFTLLELLVVLVILALLMGLAGPRVMALLGQARHKAATLELARLGTVLDLYHLDIGQYPTSESGLGALLLPPANIPRWNGPYLKGRLPADPWGRPYGYLRPGRRGPGFDYDLFTLGADGVPGGTGENADIYYP